LTHRRTSRKEMEKGIARNDCHNLEGAGWCRRKMRCCNYSGGTLQGSRAWSKNRLIRHEQICWFTSVKAGRGAYAIRLKGRTDSKCVGGARLAQEGGESPLYTLVRGKINLNRAGREYSWGVWRTAKRHYPKREKVGKFGRRWTLPRALGHLNFDGGGVVIKKRTR